jgi:hypothetical protein
MIRVLMLDVGNTLLRESDGSLFPHVLEALECVRQFETEGGDPLARCLVSDYPRDLPVPQAKLNGVMKEFQSLLPDSLLTYFQPVDRLVTLSAHAGVSKPDRHVFETALERLGSAAQLNECLFITEDVPHIKVCRRFGTETLQFGGFKTRAVAGSDFNDWIDAPGLIARHLNSKKPGNLATALKAWLAVRFPTLKEPRVQSSNQADTWIVRGQESVPLNDPSLGELDGVFVPMGTQFEVNADRDGKFIATEAEQNEKETIEEMAHSVRSLISNGQVAGTKMKSPRVATHQVVTDAEGRRYLERILFT